MLLLSMCRVVQMTRSRDETEIRAAKLKNAKTMRVLHSENLLRLLHPGMSPCHDKECSMPYPLILKNWDLIPIHKSAISPDNRASLSDFMKQTDCFPLLLYLGKWVIWGRYQNFSHNCMLHHRSFFFVVQCPAEQVNNKTNNPGSIMSHISYSSCNNDQMSGKFI